MINELYELSAAMDQVGVQAQNWHRKYKPIPKIRPDAQCVRIVLSKGAVAGLSEISEAQGECLRKYGSNQGSYPCMNLAPLYRVTDKEIKKQLSALRPEELTEEKLREIKSWCSVNNWGGSNFRGKYKISMVKTPAELHDAAEEYEPLRLLMEESSAFADPDVLHQKLEAAVWRMLAQGENTSLALKVLFYQGKAEEKAEKDYGSLSVALDAEKLIEMGASATDRRFVTELNHVLLRVSETEQDSGAPGETDAFGIPFDPLEEPMPSVKLAGGFDVTLRTMFKEQRCQTRYGTIENASYPISPQMRKKVQAALAWLGAAERKEITWINTERNEVLFAYPASLPEKLISYTRMFRLPNEQESSFTAQARQFIQELRQTRKPGTDSHADRIRIFILRKIDKARTKIVYTRQTDAWELEACSEAWTAGCTNLPIFYFGQPDVLFSLQAADVLNRFWKQNGKIVTDKFKPVPKYHGMELLMEPGFSTVSELRMLTEKEMALGAFLGSKLAKGDLHHFTWDKIKELLALTGLLLYRNGIRKEHYMETLPYLYGQLLKASDELHVLYCKVVRAGDIPPQLAGGTLFQSAAEMPLRTLNLLSKRIMPYYTWAKSYRWKNVMKTGEESWRAGWFCSVYERIMTQLQGKWTPQIRFNEEEKAQLFIGYLAAFPRKEKIELDLQENTAKEETENG